jgi:hypothetical protein
VTILAFEHQFLAREECVKVGLPARFEECTEGRVWVGCVKTSSKKVDLKKFICGATTK